MKIFSAGANKTLDQGKKRACVVANLLLTPGLGTIMAGRYMAGSLQLLLACAGFLMFLSWIVLLFQTVMSGRTEVGQNWLWQRGLLLFAASWLAALWSSLGILRNKAEAGTIPPKLNA